MSRPAHQAHRHISRVLGAAEEKLEKGICLRILSPRARPSASCAEAACPSQKRFASDRITCADLFSFTTPPLHPTGALPPSVAAFWSFGAGHARQRGAFISPVCPLSHCSGARVSVSRVSSSSLSSSALSSIQTTHTYIYLHLLYTTAHPGPSREGNISVYRNALHVCPQVQPNTAHMRTSCMKPKHDLNYFCNVLCTFDAENL